MKIIINADDFGYSDSINRGIIDSFKNGLISTTTIMINMPYAKEALELWKENKKLGLGLHINLTEGKPISDNILSLVDNNGNFIYIEDCENRFFKEEDIYKEVKAQIEKLKSFDVDIDHLDCHHGLTDNKAFRKVFLNLAIEYSLPIRAVEDDIVKEARRLNIKVTDLWCGEFYDENAEYTTILDYVRNNSVDSIEIMTHIGYIDDDTRKRTLYLGREKEIEELKKLKTTGFYNNINLVTYKEL
jgi:predicted glycoside hydrolase/deacetylase ChbG (UPF0249 family)